MRNKIDALMLVPMDSNFIGKAMFTSMTSNDVSEHAPVKTSSSISMKTRILANIYSVLKDVEIQIATKKQINALMVVPTDYTSRTKER